MQMSTWMSGETNSWNTFSTLPKYCSMSVSYTHLDVYKRQVYGSVYRVALRIGPAKDGVLIGLPCQMVQLFQLLPQSAQGGDSGGVKEAMTL